MARYLAARGIRLLRRVAGASAQRRPVGHQWAKPLRQVEVDADVAPAGRPRPAAMFDDWVYKRGALTLRAAPAYRRRRLLRTTGHWTDKYRYGSVGTEDFIALASHHGAAARRAMAIVALRDDTASVAAYRTSWARHRAHRRCRRPRCGTPRRRYLPCPRQRPVVRSRR